MQLLTRSPKKSVITGLKLNVDIPMPKLQIRLFGIFQTNEAKWCEILHSLLFFRSEKRSLIKSGFCKRSPKLFTTENNTITEEGETTRTLPRLS